MRLTFAIVPDKAAPICVGILVFGVITFTAGKRFRIEFGADTFEGVRLTERQADFRALDDHVEILNVAQVLRVDERPVVRIGRL